MTVRPYECEQIRALGRHTGDGRLLWTGSGYEFTLTSPKLTAVFEVDFAQYEPWVAVVLNDSVVSRFPLGESVTEMTLLSGLEPGAPHRVRIIRETQAMPDDPSLYLKINTLTGEFGEPPEKSLNIEFIGDSITSGEGVMGTAADKEWLPIWFSCVKAFPFLTAESLNADFRVLSQSGWGVCASYDNNPRRALPQYYDDVCGVVLSGAGSAKVPNDFGAWKPDVVVCSLGTNDNGAFMNPPGINGETDESFKITEEAFSAAEEAFMRKLRARNPDAYILRVFFDYADPVLKLVKQAFKRVKDKRSELLIIPFPDFVTGARLHPGKAENIDFAERITERIKSATRKNT